MNPGAASTAPESQSGRFVPFPAALEVLEALEALEGGVVFRMVGRLVPAAFQRASSGLPSAAL